MTLSIRQRNTITKLFDEALGEAEKVWDQERLEGEPTRGAIEVSLRDEKGRDARCRMSFTGSVLDEWTKVSGEQSVQPEWCRKLPLQQQSVLFLAGRGPDGIAKFHPCKAVHVAYRGTIFIAAKYGRPLEWGEKADTFMSLDKFADNDLWREALTSFFENAGEVSFHYFTHLMHGAQICGYKHPDERFRDRWHEFYIRCVLDMHLSPESEAEMDKRLGDWGREYWGERGK
jgi:hypothetical protein